METPARFIRLATGFVLAFIAVVASTAYRPAPLTGQEGGYDPCVEALEEELGPCVETRHSWKGDPCTGSSCWTKHEICCLEDIVVTIQ